MAAQALRPSQRRLHGLAVAHYQRQIRTCMEACEPWTLTHTCLVNLEQPVQAVEISLPAGRMTQGVIRRGGQLLRPMGAWSGAVHEYLRHLESAGFAGAPRYLGTDGEREILTFIDGEVPAARPCPRAWTGHPDIESESWFPTGRWQCVENGREAMWVAAGNVMTDGNLVNPPP
jgi:hypothetical protein